MKRRNLTITLNSVKEVAYASKVSTNIIVLKRFADQEDTSSNKDITEAGFVFRKEEFKQNVISLLEKSKDNMMGVLDAIKTLVSHFYISRET